MPNEASSENTPLAVPKAPDIRRPILPWSAKAMSVFNGMVFTVPGSISSSTYFMSLYDGSLVPVDAHRSLWGAAPSPASFLNLSPCSNILL